MVGTQEWKEGYGRYGLGPKGKEKVDVQTIPLGFPGRVRSKWVYGVRTKGTGRDMVYVGE